MSRGAYWRAPLLFVDNGLEMAGQRDPDAARRIRRALISSSIVGLVSAATFGLLLWSVLAHSGLTGADLDVATFVAGHRMGWLTRVMKVVTWLGSSFVIIPLGVAVGGLLWRRRHTWRPMLTLAAAFLGAAALYDIVKPLVARARPPAALQVGGPDEGWAFPSGHATQTIAFYGMLAIVLTAGSASRRRLLFALGAALVTVVVGASRLYLGVHWLTDVLGGYALGLTWLAVVVTALLVRAYRRAPH
jgi:undecaprenyl-diphosphatase